MLGAIHITSATLVYISAGLPLLIGFALKNVSTPRYKAIVMLVATAAVALIKSATDKGGIIDAQLFQDWVKATAYTAATYYGVWNPLGLGNLAPTVGLPGPTNLPDGTQTPND